MQVSAEAERRLKDLHCDIGDNVEICLMNGQDVPGQVWDADDHSMTLRMKDNGTRQFRWADIQVVVNHSDRPAPPPPAQRPSHSNSGSQPTSPAIDYASKRSRIEKIKLLGQGAQGQVWQCRYTDSAAEDFIVVKEMLFVPQHINLMKEKLEQARRIQSLSHQHLIKYLDAFVEEKPAPKLSVIMPYYKESDMFEFITSLRQPLTEYKLCSLVLQIAKALAYLHTLNPPMVHRDVKPENILMFDGWDRTLLMDLDTSRAIERGQLGGNMTQVGTFEYMAPEVQYEALASPKCDVWSLGVVMYVLMSLPEFLTIPHPQKGDRRALNDKSWTAADFGRAIIKEIEVNEKASQQGGRKGVVYSAKVKQLMLAMLSHDLQQRPSSPEVVQELEELMLICLTGGAM